MSFFKKKKEQAPDPQANLAAAAAETRNQRQAALKNISSAFTGARQNLDQAANRFNPQVSQALFDRGLDRYQNFEQNAKLAEDNAYNANYQPILNEVQANLGNQFAGMGAAGRGNSRGQFAQAVLSQNLADNAGKQLMGIRNDARNNLLQENQALFNPAMDLQQQLVGIDTNKANAFTNLGQTQANTRLGFASPINNLASQQSQTATQQGQQAAARKSNNKGGIGSMIGGGMNLVGSMFGGKK